MAYTVDHIDLRIQPGPTSVSGTLLRSSSFDAPHIFPSNDSNPYLPSITVSGGSQVDLGLTFWFPYGPYNSNPIVTWKENLTWIKGKHSIVFGFDAAHNHMNHWQPEVVCCPRGYVVSSEHNTFLNLAGDGSASCSRANVIVCGNVAALEPGLTG